MSIYHIINEEYNINFDLKFDTFYNFFDSLKESTKHYSDYCNLKNINIIDFDNEYIILINILKSELLKFYILVTNDDNDYVEKYVAINDEIKALYNSIIKLPNSFGSRNDCTNEIIKASLNINYLSKKKLSVLIKIYAYYCIMPSERNNFNNLDTKLLNRIGIIQIIPSQIFLCDEIFDVNDTNNLNKYLDSLNYESIYERELTKILTTLPDIVSQILYYNQLNKISNKSNLIDLNEDLDDKYIAVD